MHLKKYLVALIIIACFAQCKQADKSNTTSSPNTDSSSSTTKQIESREAFFYRQTMDIHNEVMGKMGKLNGYKKQVQQQTDSIKSLLASTDFPKPLSQRIAKDLDSLDVLGKKLQTADSSMNAWMEQFDPDPKLADSNANADYFEKQKKSAEMMKATFFKALKDAEDLFASPK